MFETKTSTSILRSKHKLNTGKGRKREEQCVSARVGEDGEKPENACTGRQGGTLGDDEARLAVCGG